MADVPIFAEYVGQTEARANVDVRARVEGFVKSIKFREGSVVREGEVLFEIEKEPIEQRLYRAQATLAEAEQHHPDLHVAWGKVRVEVWTHKIRGLHKNDFILAAKTDRLFTPHPA